MTSPVKRRYDGEARRAASQATRRRLLQASRELFVAKGYRATTVGEIARRAGAHVDTLYTLVGRKPQILHELIESAISGEDEPVPPEARDYVRRMEAEPDPAAKLAIYAGAVAAIQVRMAPLLLALSDAATTDPAARRVWTDIADRRARNMRLLVAGLGDDVLRAGLDADEAADVIWATASSEMFLLLTRDRGWPLDRYQRWLAESWTVLLLGPSR